MLRILLLFIFMVSTVAARPVSYPGGWTFMTRNDGDRYSTHVHYSPTAFYSLGYRAEHWRESDYTLQTMQMNNLLKRWNKRHSQANLYLKSGLGVAYSDAGDFDSEWEPVAMVGIAADWETRRYFVSYENRLTWAGDIADNFRQSARVGIAAYIAGFGSLHTWLMLEVRHEPESSDSLTVTPLIRLFKGPSLLETGLSNKGDLMFNFVHRF